MKQVYKSIGNLKKVWKHLDNACGDIDNAVIAIGGMKDVPEEVLKAAEGIDFSAIVSLKNEIEAMIEEKGGSEQNGIRKN